MYMYNAPCAVYTSNGEKVKKDTVCVTAKKNFNNADTLITNNNLYKSIQVCVHGVHIVAHIAVCNK